MLSCPQFEQSENFLEILYCISMWNLLLWMHVLDVFCSTEKQSFYYALVMTEVMHYIGVLMLSFQRHGN